MKIWVQSEGWYQLINFQRFSVLFCCNLFFVFGAYCTALRHHCTAFGFNISYTEVLANTDNPIKTWTLLQQTGGKDISLCLNVLIYNKNYNTVWNFRWRNQSSSEYIFIGRPSGTLSVNKRFRLVRIYVISIGHDK